MVWRVSRHRLELAVRVSVDSDHPHVAPLANKHLELVHGGGGHLVRQSVFQAQGLARDPVVQEGGEMVGEGQRRHGRNQRLGLREQRVRRRLRHGAPDRSGCGVAVVGAIAVALGLGADDLAPAAVAVVRDVFPPHVELGTELAPRHCPVDLCFARAVDRCMAGVTFQVYAVHQQDKEQRHQYGPLGPASVLIVFEAIGFATASAAAADLALDRRVYHAEEVPTFVRGARFFQRAVGHLVRDRIEGPFEIGLAGNRQHVAGPDPEVSQALD